MMQFIKLLAEINVKNSKRYRLTTSSRFQNQAKLFLRRLVKTMQCGKLKVSSDQSRKSLANYLRSKTSFDERFAVFITRHKMNISDNARNALLVVVGLLVAATFPAIFSPPGSVQQGDNNNNHPTTVINGTTYINTTASVKPSPLPGTVVMDSGTFLYFSMYNTGTVHAAI